MTEQVFFWDIDMWSFITTLGILFGALLLANMLRRLIPPLRRSLIPSSVIAGFLILLVDWLFKTITGSSMFTRLALEAMTYHCLGLGIVAMTFRTSEKVKDKERNRDIFNSGLLTVSGYLIQAITGLVITIGLFYAIGSFASSGMLLPMGYGQGPGQAFNWGKIYEQLTEYPAFANGSSFGLSVAAMGFVSASIGGVVYMNVMKRKGKLSRKVEGADETEDLSAEMVTKKGEIPLAESLDKLTVQFALVFLAYILGYALMYVLTTYVFDPLGGFFAGTVKPLMWGFNFLMGMLFVFIIKGVMRLFKKWGVAKREYTNSFMLNRISGLTFDLMVVASIAAIDLSAFRHREFILPLILVCVAGFFVSFFFVRFCSHRLFPKYPSEQFLVMFGMLTGTVSTGLILLREIDPLYETPAATNVIFQNLWAIVFGFPMLLLMGIVYKGMTMTWLTLGILVLLFAGMILLLFRSVIFKRRKQKVDNK